MKQSRIVGLVMIGMAAIGCADSAGISSGNPGQLDVEHEFDVDPRGTYLRTVWDPPNAPTVVLLDAIDAGGGDTLVLRRLGAFEDRHGHRDDRMAGLFSGSDSLLPNPSFFGDRARVPDAIEAGDNVDTPNTFFWRRPTNVQEDFEIGDELEITVPPGATHLFLTAIDDYFANNHSKDFKISITVVNQGPDLCDGVACDDGNACTADACDPVNGTCGSVPAHEGDACDFGGLPGVCSGGACVDAMLCAGVSCDDGNGCTADTCDPADGSCFGTPLPDGTECDALGLPGQCASGTCVGSNLCENVDCDDLNECTADLCDPNDGACAYTNVADGTGCNFGGLPGICSGGTCEDALLCSGVVCDDGDECTAGSCDPIDGSCGYANVPDGTACGTAGQSCLGGVCQGGMLEPATIDATIACTLPLGLGNANVDVSIELAPMSVWTGTGSTVSVEGTATTVIAASLGQLLVDLGSDQLTLDYIISEVTVNGGTPSPTTITLPGQTIDVDANDDGTAEAVTLVIPAGSYDVTSTGAPTLDFTLTHIETGLSGLPLLGSIVVSETSPPSTISCTLTSTTAVFPGM